MLFQELSKLKRTSIMTSIVMMAVGIVMMICPEPYIQALIGTLGYGMIILSLVMILDFISSKKALIHFVYLTLALIIGILGVAVLAFDADVVRVLSIVFGLWLLADGVSGMFNAWMYARRSQRKGWWLTIVFSGLMIVFGLIVLINPWWNSPHALLYVIGEMLLYSSVTSVLRLIWTWPIKDV